MGVVPPIAAPHAHYVPTLLFEETAGINVTFERSLVFRVQYLIHLQAEHITIALFVIHRNGDLVRTATEIGIDVIAERAQFCRDLLFDGNGDLGMTGFDCGRAEGVQHGIRLRLTTLGYRSGIGEVCAEQFGTVVFGAVHAQVFRFNARNDVYLFLCARNGDVKPVFAALDGKRTEVSVHFIVFVASIAYTEYDYVAFVALYVLYVFDKQADVLSVLFTRRLFKVCRAEFGISLAFLFDSVLYAGLLLHAERDYAYGVRRAALEQFF